MNTDRTNEAAKSLVKLAQESSKALTDTAITAQERNLAFAQGVLENGIEVLKSHAESTRTLMQELVEQARKQQVGPEGLQVLMDNAVAAQERNTRFAQGVFENGIELLKSQIDVTHSLLQEMEQQAQKRQAVFQTLAQESMEAYKDFLFAPLSFWQRSLDTAGSVTQEGLKNFQNATLQGMETMQKTTQQAVAMMEKSLPRN
jgi:DNA-binding helix-hairpin-helix protein with protein kinase domain